MDGCLENEIVQGVIAILLVVLILGLFGWLKFRRDSKTVARLLENAGLERSPVNRRAKRGVGVRGQAKQQHMKSIWKRLGVKRRGRDRD